MSMKGRIQAVMTTLVILNFYAIYYLIRDGYMDWILWISYPIVLPIAYYAGVQYDRAKYFAEKDPLTGLYNRRYIMNFYDRFAAIARRNQSSMFVMILDCNDFKTINDQYGHKVGDEVLKAIGHILLSKTRDTDIATRWGGDEFMLIGHFKDIDGLQSLTERIREQIELLSKQMNLPISTSIGTSVCAAHKIQLQDLLITADELMYADKKRSKDIAG